MKYLIVGGRWLYSVIFIMAGFGHFKAQTIGYAASQGVPLASLAVLMMKHRAQEMRFQP